jgi:5'-methylthioadenosine phosphorylase
VKIDVAIIGGTGIGSRLADLPGRTIAVPTADGVMRGRLVRFGGVPVLAIQRHSSGHATPPHLVNYRAIALGLKSLGVRTCFATAAVGSLDFEQGPGTMLACTDFIDVSGRNLTVFDRVVHHTPLDHPFGEGDSFLRRAGLGGPNRVVYVQATGPRYETHAEISAYKTLGGDIVGMTAASEATVMREAGVGYECLAIVSNLAAGIGGEIDHGAVTDVVGSVAPKALAILERAAALAAAG